jgi:hypothetical protein
MSRFSADAAILPGLSGCLYYCGEVLIFAALRTDFNVEIVYP